MVLEVDLLLARHCASIARVMPLDLSSSERKFERALTHLDELNSLHDRLIAEANVQEARAEAEFDKKRRCWVFRATGLVEFPVDASPVLGDYFHNLRSALDHLAWQLFLLRNDPIGKHADTVQFPLYSLRGRRDVRDKGFFGNLYRRLPCVDPVYVAIIEGYQPYPRRKQLRPLALLARLSNDDKHRAIIPVSLNTTLFQPQAIAVYGQLIRLVISLRPGQPVHNGAEVLRVWTDPSDAGPQMKAHLTSVISFESGEPLYPMLTDMAELVGAILLRFGAAIRPPHQTTRLPT